MLPITGVCSSAITPSAVAPARTPEWAATLPKTSFRSMIGRDHQPGAIHDDVAYLESPDIEGREHRLPGRQEHESFRVRRRGSVLAAEGEHGEGRIRCEEGRDAHEEEDSCRETA